MRRRLGKGQKVGHAGTLDPFATGLLLVLVGRATRVQRFLMALPKRYETVARLGWTSTTGDRDGELAPGRTPAEPFTLPTGRILQRPPAYSAVKVGGRRAYDIARAGETVELAEREVEVMRFELTGREEDRATFAIECSSGTYVRVADLRPRRRLLPGAAPHGDRPLRRRRRRPRADRAARRRARLPAGRDARGRGGPPRVPRRGRGRRGRTASCGCSTRTGLIALAEPREDGLLKPVVGFRAT